MAQMDDVARYADDIMVRVERDMEAGIIPSDVSTFSELHDYCDENCYLDGVPWGETTEDVEASLAVNNAVSDEIDRRLAARALGGSVVDLYGLAAGDRVMVLPRSSDHVSAPWVVTVLDVVLPSRDSDGGVWTSDFAFVPAKRVRLAT